MPTDHDSLFIRVEDAQVADARQDTIELLERSCEAFSQRFNEGVGVNRFAQLL
jgi:hypothetical protein